MKKYKDNIKYQPSDNDLCDLKEQGKEYKEITEDAFINKGYKFLFVTHCKNLTTLQRLRMNQIMNDYDHEGYIREARIFKERFVKSLDDLDYDSIVEIRDQCLSSNHYRIKGFGKTLLNWDIQIKNYCLHSNSKFKFTNAVTEAYNNQCKICKRVSGGFKTKDNYKKKLSARFCTNILLNNS